MANNLIIALDRQYGSGGKEVGIKLAEKLGLKVYDEEILDIAAKKSGIGKEYFQKVDEKPTDSFLYALAMNNFSVNSTVNPLDNALSSDNLFNLQAEAIKDIACQESCIIIGRCADYILREETGCISVFILADMDKRIERICKLYQLNEKEASKQIHSIDKKRDSYYGYYAGKEWASCNSYHLSIDTGILGIDKAVELINYYINLKNKK